MMLLKFFVSFFEHVIDEGFIKNGKCVLVFYIMEPKVLVASIMMPKVELALADSLQLDVFGRLHHEA